MILYNKVMATLSPHQYRSLSKTMSRALRHAPHEYGLVLNDEGWCDVNMLIAGLQLRGRTHKWDRLTITDIQAMMNKADKQRYELVNGRIRAVYGHSIDKKLTKRMSEPPPVLYHGTRPDVIDVIMQEGLRPMARQYVHLSVDVETATLVAKRRTQTPIILTVHAAQAYSDSIKFYAELNGVWLSEPIPAHYLELPTSDGS